MRKKLFLAFLLSFMMAFSSVNVFAEDEVPATDDVAEVVEETEAEEATETEEVVTAGTTEETVEAVKTNVSATSYKVEQVEGTRDITVTMAGLDKLISSKKYDEVRVYFKMYYKSKAVVSKTVKQKLSEIDAETKAFKATVPYYGKYKVTVKLYKKKKSIKTLTKKTLGVTAKAYNIMDMNATTPVLITSLKMLTNDLPTYEEKAGEGEAAEVTEGEEEAEKEKIEIPTIVTLYRGGAYNWKALPEHVYKCPYIKDSYNKVKGHGEYKHAAIAQYTKDLYNLDKTSHFNFYNNDYHLERYVQVAYKNKIPAANMSTILVTDGSATYSVFKRVYGGLGDGEAVAKHEKMVKEWQKYKANIYAGKKAKLTYDINDYPYAVLDAEAAEDIDAKWWVVRKSIGDTFKIDDPQMMSKVNADKRISNNYINNLLKSMQEAKKDEIFKKWYNFDDSQIKNAVAAGKIPMMILGTSEAGEKADPVDPFVRFTMAYYGGDYAYFYKGHPGYITEDDPKRVARMQSLGMDILESSIAAELFCYYNEDLHMSGYQSSTFQNIGDEKTHGGIYNVRLGTFDQVYKDTIDFTIIKLSKVNDEALTALAKDAGHENYLVEFNTGKEYDIAIWDADTSYAYYYKKDDEGNYNLEKEEYALKPQTITTSKTSYTVKKGKTVKLGAKTTGNGLLTYKSSNKKVAKVSSKGTVTGVKKGKVTITVTASSTGANEKATKKVTVTVK